MNDVRERANDERELQNEEREQRNMESKNEAEDESCYSCYHALRGNL